MPSLTQSTPYVEQIPEAEYIIFIDRLTTKDETNKANAEKDFIAGIKPCLTSAPDEVHAAKMKALAQGATILHRLETEKRLKKN